MKNEISLSLSDILNNLLKNNSLEQQLLEGFPNLRILRGLPRVYQKANPSLSYIKSDFSQLFYLKKLLLEKLLLPRYIAPKSPKLCLFTYMLSDGWGDLIAHKEIYKILIKQFPDLTSIVCVPKGFTCNDSNSLVISYEKECHPKEFPKEARFAIQNADLIVSTPTHYPFAEELKNYTDARCLQIGQYGFVESNHFSPTSNHYSMGLHFLELGILTRQNVERGDFRNLENQTLLYTLFGTTTPQTVEIENYRASHSFYLAYLVSPIGGAVYLHSLLLSHKSNHTIDICTPDIGWLISYSQLQKGENKPFFASDLGISDLEIHFAGKIHRRHLSKEGKKVRIICPGPLSDLDFRKLMILSEEFVAVRGDQSFSEAISANRIFFYDGARHARYFMKDLLALAENKLCHNLSSLSVFRAMNQAFAYNIPDETSEWVEETYFQQKEPWENIAKKIGSALLSPLTLKGFKQLNQIIKQEYSCNNSISQLISRELYYRAFPEREAFEKEQIERFAEGKQTLKEALLNIKRL